MYNTFWTFNSSLHCMFSNQAFKKPLRIFFSTTSWILSEWDAQEWVFIWLINQLFGWSIKCKPVTFVMSQVSALICPTTQYTCWWQIDWISLGIQHSIHIPSVRGSNLTRDLCWFFSFSIKCPNFSVMFTQNDIVINKPQML